MTQVHEQRWGVRYVENPISVLRLAGIPVSDSMLPAGQTIDAIAQLAAARVHYNASKQVACDAIAALVPKAHNTDKALARNLLEIKRDLFNGRPPRASALDSLGGAVPADLLGALTRLARDAGTIRDAVLTIPCIHAAEISRGIEQSIRTVAVPEILRAIEVTNSGIHRRIVAMSRDPESLSAKVRGQTGIGAARYVLRAGQKTSPLSSFGVVALGDNSVRSDHVGDVAREIVRRAEPNYGALDFVTELAIAEIVNIADDAQVCINSSAVTQDGKHEWQRVGASPADQRVRHTNIATIQSRSKLLTAVARIIAFENDMTTLPELRNKLLTLLPRNAPDKIDAALAEAWRKGFLVLAISQDQHPVDIARGRVKALVQPLRARLSTAQERFITAARDPAAPYVDVQAALRNYMGAVGQDRLADDVKPILFEDCTVVGDTPAAKPLLSDDVERSLRMLLRLSPMLTADSVITRLRCIAVKEFKAIYGEAGKCSNVELFLKICSARVSALVIAEAAERENMIREAREASAMHATLYQLREQWLNDIAERSRSGLDIVLLDGDIEKLVAAMPIGAGAPTVSHVFFIQATPGERGADYVLNNTYPGASGTFSRFISEDHSAIGRIGAYLEEISGEARYLELTGTFAFNAAVHPRFTRDTVSIPPFLSPIDKTTNVTHLKLRHRPQHDDLLFIDADGRDVAIYFTSILNPLTMPLQHQITRAIGSWVDVVEDIGRSVADRVEPDSQGIRHIPRITYRRLVIARARHVVPRTAIPDAKLASDAFFVAFNEWADRRGMPRHLFAGRHLSQVDAMQPMPETSDRGSARRIVKPMPLDRWSPLAVVVLQREVAANDGSIVFVEALPNVDQTVVTRGGRQVVSEYAVELTMMLDNQPTGAGTAR